VAPGRPEATTLAAAVSEAWIAFARSGDPSHRGLPAWPAYDAAPGGAHPRATMVLGRAGATGAAAAESRVVEDPNAAVRRLWSTV
jgi:para-nitrobenzyl esterase